jgi:hypothetical protein
MTSTPVSTAKAVLSGARRDKLAPHVSSETSSLTTSRRLWRTTCADTPVTLIR